MKLLTTCLVLKFLTLCVLMGAVSGCASGNYHADPGTISRAANSMASGIESYKPHYVQPQPQRICTQNFGAVYCY
jgi:outer membrane lipoprotein-sorting protein